jgi:polyhydroxyalkanoate synthesis regulator phasin
MKHRIVSILVAVLLTVSGIVVAQEHGGEHDQQKAKGSMMHANMGMMAEMMSKMSQMMSSGKMGPEHQKQCANMMKKMSQMMQEMSVPHGKEVQEKHQRELQEMEEELNPLFNHLVHP